jgi:cytosine/adenosine deaminase-related metal-dependent hydrolase
MRTEGTPGIDLGVPSAHSRGGVSAWRARLVWSGEGWIDDGVVACRRGRVAWVGSARAWRRRGATPVDLGEVALLRGLVDAHAHLDLSHARIDERTSFDRWVGAVVAARRAAPADASAAITAGEESLLRGGCTSVGDIDGGVVPRRGGAARLRTLAFVEVLDAHDPLRARAVSERLARAGEREGRLLRALSPHAPHTVSAGLLRRAARLRGPLQIHCAESAAEVEWMLAGTGPFAAWLAASPRRAPLEHLLRAGVLRTGTTLVHANHLEPERDGPLLARRGVALVHCPGTHRWFARAPFPLDAWRRQGVRVVLGTDSLASNDVLDCRHEAALAIDTLGASPLQALRMLGDEAEDALGRPFGRTGLGSGARADFAAHRTTAAADAALEDLLRSRQSAALLWIGGRQVLLCGATDGGASASVRA